MLISEQQITIFCTPVKQKTKNIVKAAFSVIKAWLLVVCWTFVKWDDVGF